MSVSGGAVGLIADQAEPRGIELAELSPATREQLSGMLHRHATVKNPLDVTGQLHANPPLFRRFVQSWRLTPMLMP